MPITSGETGETVSARVHYDRLIDEGNDPVLDPPALRAYMDGWDGEAFLDALMPLEGMRALEIGVGTGRLARRVLERGCAALTGLDESARTIERARTHLAAFAGVTLMTGVFPHDAPAGPFDRIYASLTFFHIPDKALAVRTMAGLLAPGGRAVISLDKARDEFLDFGTRRVRLYPDDPEKMAALFGEAGCRVAPAEETRFAWIVKAEKIYRNVISKRMGSDCAREKPTL